MAFNQDSINLNPWISSITRCYGGICGFMAPMSAQIFIWSCQKIWAFLFPHFIFILLNSINPLGKGLEQQWLVLNAMLEGLSSRRPHFHQCLGLAPSLCTPGLVWAFWRWQRGDPKKASRISQLPILCHVLSHFLSLLNHSICVQLAYNISLNKKVNPPLSYCPLQFVPSSLFYYLSLWKSAKWILTLFSPPLLSWAQFKHTFVPTTPMKLLLSRSPPTIRWPNLWSFLHSHFLISAWPLSPGTHHSLVYRGPLL